MRNNFRNILATFSALALAACATTPPPIVDHLVTRDVLISVREPCPDPKDIPAQPGRVAAEHPTMPAAGPLPTDLADAPAWIAALRGEIIASHERERILGAKVLEWITYGEKSSRIMKACSAPNPPAGATSH
jgi:hypothetical protein